MGNILSGLKKLYAAMGGTDSVDTIKSTGKMIDKIADVAGGGGGGGAGTLVLHATYEEDGEIYTFTLDKTAGEIAAAINDDVLVTLYIGGSDETSSEFDIWTLGHCGYGPYEETYTYGFEFFSFNQAYGNQGQLEPMEFLASAADAETAAGIYPTYTNGGGGV